MEFTGERVVPWARGMRDWVHVLQHHLARYTWALRHVSGRRVVDIGCGTGYGAHILSFVAESVMGVDISPDAVDFASEHFSRANCSFANGDALDAVQFPADVYVCFECLEHLVSPSALVHAVRATGAGLVWSVPTNDPGRFHRHVYDMDSAARLVPGSVVLYQGDDGAIVNDWTASAPPKYIVGVLP